MFSREISVSLSVAAGYTAVGNPSAFEKQSFPNPVPHGLMLEESITPCKLKPYPASLLLATVNTMYKVVSLGKSIHLNGVVVI
jgi:hypothetical protein